MAHLILGVDPGAHTLKLARFEASFRKATLLEVELYPVENPPGEATAAPPVEGQAAPEPPSALERLCAQLHRVKQAIVDGRTPIEEVALALPGDLLTFRLIDLPFSDPRKIESVLGYELEAQVLTSIDELIIDHLVVGSAGGGETRVLCAAAPKATVAALVQTAAELDLPLRLVGAAPLGYALLLPTPQGPAEEPPQPVLVVDIGHAHTTMCAVRSGKPELARSLPRGGQHFTEAVATGFRLPFAEAERAKLDAGFLSHRGLAPETPGQMRMDECLREAARPLLRELRQTLASYRASYNEPIHELHLTGGASRLVGLAEHFSEELGLPVSPLPWPEHEGWRNPDASDRDRVGIAVALGQAAAGSAPSLNFRRGEFAYRTDYSFLRSKALSLGIAALAILSFAALNAFASLRGLRKEEDALSARLRAQTLELFGQERLDGKAISDELKGGPKGSGPPPIPTLSAFDVLDEISHHVPTSDQIKLDIVELDIKPKKTFLKATAESAQQVDDLVDALSKIECFEEIQKGKLSSVTGPAKPSEDPAKPAEKTELKQFTLTIITSCP